jgi:16S rRNA (cytosine1402-N4)-methyltransferase
MSDYQHRPVLLEEAVDALNIRPDGIYLDGTFGRGGHSRAILARLSQQGCLFSLDRDPEAVAAGKKELGDDTRFSIVQGEFAEMERFVHEWGVEEGLDGILLDIGVSSPQLDDPGRGFSFMGDGPLDMRMNPLQGVSADEWLAEASERELTRVFREFGEERHARRIARSIVCTRQKQRLETTGQLARLIEETIGRREKNKHPATRCFQAIRIFINDEMAQLAQGLEEAIKLLRPGGRLVVISFHSLEDRLVKRTIREAARPGPVRKNIPQHPDHKPLLKPIGRAIKASETELSVNPRARSAVMRIAEKLG